MMVTSSVEQDTKPRAFSVATELHPQHSLAVVSRVKPKESPVTPRCSQLWSSTSPAFSALLSFPSLASSHISLGCPGRTQTPWLKSFPCLQPLSSWACRHTHPGPFLCTPAVEEEVRLRSNRGSWRMTQVFLSLESILK